MLDWLHRGTRQTRTFVYNDAGLLTSATNPENGTVSYTYGSNNVLATKTDAKGQETVYLYDSAGHMTQSSVWVSGTLDPCQTVQYYYGTDPTVFSYSRLIGTLSGTNSQVCITGEAPTAFSETYTYNSAGAVATKGIGIWRSWTDGGGATWTAGSGLARNVGQYKRLPANCDLARRDDLDGRGTLSEEGCAT